MRVTVNSAGLTLDVDVTIVDPEATLGEVVRAITGVVAGSTITVDGWPYRPDQSVGVVPLHNGSVIADEPSDAVADLTGGVEIIQIAGEGAGRSIVLPRGSFDIGRPRDGHVTEAVFRLELDDGSEPIIQALGPEPILVDGEPVPPGASRTGDVIATTTQVFRVRTHDGVRPPVLPLSDNGRIPFQRPPRQLGFDPAEAPAVPDAPKDPQEQQPFSWLVAVAPIPMGIVAAIFFSPFFLIFILMSPILAGARWFDGRRRNRKDQERFAAERVEIAADFAVAMQRWSTDEARRRRTVSPDLSRLDQRVRALDPGLWERRIEHSDYLRLVVGIGDVQAELPKTKLPETDAITATAGRLRSVPVTVNLALEPSIGIVGPRDRTRSLAGALLAEVAVTHGPADVAIMLLVDRARQLDWDWIKWLPHLEDDRGYRYVASDPGAAAALLASLPRPEMSTSTGRPALPRPLPVIMVDGPDFVQGTFTALSGAVRANAARAIVLADTREQLPAICSTVVDLNDAVTVTSMATGNVDRSPIPVLLDHDVAATMARGISAYRDPDRQTQGSDLPQQCDLRSLLGGDLSAPVVTARWVRGVEQPQGVIGVAQHGPLRLNLVTDGPHALIAGTTGSGKSELLRTMVASFAAEQGPDRLNFVLVDFKGGGAFDACASLPHTVGLVTDLDEHLAARALRCLKAELRYREHKLRDAEVSDLRDYDVPGDPLPRVVVVVDEFATLAAELPEFMASLVDVAQRGRSLGIHMILATQRPSGVVDAKIRANTNMRISLRVQDEADSNDVIGDKRAADVDRRSPGRGYVRLGASDLTQFQTAIVSLPSASDVEVPLRVTTFELVENGSDSDNEAPPQQEATDLEEFVASAQAANALLGLPPARVPWPEPLPPSIEAESLWDRAPATPWATPIGVADLPDEQRTESFWWTPDVGNVAIFGADSASTSAVMATLTIGLARTHSPDQAHVYIIDFSGGGSLIGLAEIPNVGAVVTAGDEERLVRVVDLLETELATRGDLARQGGMATIGPNDGVPLIILGIANYGGLIGYLEESNQFEFAARFERLVRDGPALGIFVVATANHERGIPTRVAGQIESRWIMRMADPNAYSSFGFRAKDMPELGPARAMDSRSKLEVQFATCERGVEAAASPNAATGGGPAPVQVLGTDIAPTEIIKTSSLRRGGLRLAIGQCHDNLAGAELDLPPGTHAVVSGGPGSGKTNALQAIAAAIRAASDRVNIVVLARDRDEWPEAVDSIDAETLEGAGPTVVLIDGANALSEETERQLETVADRDDAWMVLADRPEALQSMSLLLRQLTAGRTGVILQPQPDHGDVFRCRLPLRTAKLFPPGRGFMVNGGVMEMVQLVHAAPGSDSKVVQDRINESRPG